MFNQYQGGPPIRGVYTEKTSIEYTNNFKATKNYIVPVSKRILFQRPNVQLVS